MEIIGPLVVSTIAGLSTTLGSLVIFFKWKKEHINQFITFCLSFSLAIMIGISITDLIPNSTFILLQKYKLIKGTILCILAFVVGIILVNFLNKKINTAKENIQEEKGRLYKLGILSMLALMLHNLPEGIATFMSAYQDMSLGISLGLAIMMHNIPEGISIAVPIYYATNKKSSAIKKTLLSGLAEPLGAILAYIFLSKYITNEFIAIVLLFVAGIMICLSINELLPQAMEYKENKYIYYGLLVGVFVILIQVFFL